VRGSLDSAAIAKDEVRGLLDGAVRVP